MALSDQIAHLKKMKGFINNKLDTLRDNFYEVEDGLASEVRNLDSETEGLRDTLIKDHLGDLSDVWEQIPNADNIVLRTYTFNEDMAKDLTDLKWFGYKIMPGITFKKSYNFDHNNDQKAEYLELTFSTEKVIQPKFINKFLEKYDMKLFPKPSVDYSALSRFAKNQVKILEKIKGFSEKQWTLNSNQDNPSRYDNYFEVKDWDQGALQAATNKTQDEMRYKRFKIEPAVYLELHYHYNYNHNWTTHGNNNNNNYYTLRVSFDTPRTGKLDFMKAFAKKAGIKYKTIPLVAKK